MMNVFKRFSLAVSYVTCIQLAKIDFEPESLSLNGLAKYLPAVGVLIGVLLVALAVTMNFLENEALLQGCLIAITWLWLTGGLHFDGLMDTADGIFSHQNKERILEIMHDSRVGNFGALAGVSILLLKIAGLASLHGPWQLAALACIPAWSRWCESYAIGKFHYARAYGKGKVWHDSMDYPVDLWQGAIPAGLVTATAVLFWGATTVICPLVFTIVSGIITAHWLNSKIDGHTGDTYGCVVEVAEAAGIALSAVIGSALF